MKRVHAHVPDDDPALATRSYPAPFAAEPAVVTHGNATWLRDDPRETFAIRAAGIDRLGIQVATAGGLEQVYHRFRKADRRVAEEGATTRCYAAGCWTRRCPRTSSRRVA